MPVRRPVLLVPLWLTCTLICSAQVANSHAVGVQVVSGVGEFYQRSDASVFVPRGNNYIRLAQQTHLPGYGGTFTYHSLFNVGLYDTADVETVLTEMQADGYNTVRVFLNECCSGGIGSPYGGLSYTYLANVTDFLNRAKSHGLAVLITGEWIPETGGYSAWVTPVANITGTNAFFLTAGGAQSYAKYWSDVVNGLAAQNAPFDAVLAWEVQNELYFDSTSPPLSLTSGTVTTGDGGTYDMSNAASRQSMMDNNLVYFIGQVRSAIVAVDPTALVTVSFFVPQTPNATRVGDTRLISTEPAICCSTADFIDLHPYIANLTLAQMVENFGSSGLTAKPLIMGEFGAVQSMAADAQTAAAMFQQWQVQSCSLGFDGWLLWNWDLTNTVDANYWTAMANNGEIDGALRPSTRPNACQAGPYPNEDLSFGAAATASKSLAANPPALAVDGNPGTLWSSGAFAPQWIEITLPTPSTVSGVNLTVSQSPSGPTVHDLYVQIQGGQAQLVTEFSGTTQDQQVLSWIAAAPIANVTSIKVQTVSSPSWVAWREIEVLSAAASQTISFGPLSSVNYGVSPFTISASASSGVPVSFASTTAAVCTVSGNTVTIVSGGMCSILAIQMGNSTYAQAATVTQSFTVNQLSQTISFDAIPNQILGISPFPIAGQSSVLLPVTFVSTTPAACRISDDLVMLLSAGTCSITASQPGNASYSAATSVMRSFAVNQAKPSGSFMLAQASPFAAGTGATSMAVGDFNADGVPDLAIAGPATDTVTVLLGNRSGGFQAAAGSPITVGELPQSVVVGDFNGDGFQDLALSNPNGGNITVLLGNGSGGFKPAAGSPFAAGPSPFPLVVGDFNGDGIQDLAATAGIGGRYVSVMLGNGSGAFTLAGGYSVNAPDSIAVGDFNGDGIEDLVTADGGQMVTVALGNRALGFVKTPTSAALFQAAPSAVAVGDFNGDGIQDLAVANDGDDAASGTVAVLLGDGAGGFTEVAGSILTGANPRSIVVGDFNGDGIQDIATANYQSNDVTVLLGNGSGGFAAAPGSPFAVGTTPVSLVVVDFNGDGIEDLATANYGSNDVSVLLGFAAGSMPQSIAFGPLSNVTYGVAPLAISATGTSGLPVSFASTTPAVCTVSGNAVTILGGGTCTVVASQAGNATYAAAYTVTQTFTVNPAAQTIIFGPLSDRILHSSPTLSATASSGLGVTFASNSTQVCYVSGSEVGLLGPGMCSITASQTGNASWSAATPVTQTFTASAFGIQPAAGFLDLYGAPALTFNGSTNFPDAGGLLIRAPGVTQDLSGNVYVLGLDSAGGVHLNSYNFETASWNGWQYSGGILDTTSGLTAAVDPDGVVWFTGRDIGNRFWINSWNGYTFGGWILVADGIFAPDSVPQMAIPSDGAIYVIGKDIGGRIWSNSYNPTSQTFTGWVDRQAVMIGQPSATAGQDGMVYVAVRSETSNSPVYITQIPAQNAATANTWLNGGGLIDTDPQITSQGGTVYLMAEAGNNTVYLRTFAEASQTFGAWSFTNGVLNDATIAAAAGNVYIAGRDSADRIYWYSVTGNSWFFAGGAGVSSTVLTGGK